MARNLSPSPADHPIRNSNSPVLLPPSKRDKRRAMLGEKLSDMVASFNANLRPHYEAQASAIQIDINLILRADPYQNKPLEDDAEEISRLIQSTAAGKVQIPAESAAEGDFLAGAGRLYTSFVHEVNDAMEERDCNLTLLHNKFQSNIREMEIRHAFNVRLADEEHKIMSNTIRERLMRTMNEKKNKLMKEKEQLDIGDSNAFLLHPNQFSITNPASPGGAHKRATRNTGRKPLDPDDPASASIQENKRKRKHLFQEVESQQSPASGAGRDNDTAGFASPYRDVRKAGHGQRQYDSAAFSIDNLFTEKELAMNMNTAAIAAANFLQQRQTNGQSNGSSTGHSNGFNGTHSTEEEGAQPGTATANDVDMDDDATPSAPGMERMTSHHATRGATKALTGLGAVATGDIPFAAMLPQYIPAQFGAKANSAPVAAQPLSQADIEQDLALMTRDTAGDDQINDTLLERALAPIPTSEYQYQAPSDMRELQNLGVNNSFLPPHMVHIGGVAMSAQSSLGGYSEIGGGGGGLAMSRNNSSRGVGMQRSASNQGVLGPGQDGRRVRGRLV
ncbi:hypothetical protein EJ08DRAFT_637982 [Tothia fuscella]|uniref:Uncharacterized protein n=1 Tax=Tothia fuscella TaxID=1048955 RepID=A0A9P4TV19_9PEZI|nr:hypothetical protein EJ08DRAFT_637982 [Tothia fuscella]